MKRGNIVLVFLLSCLFFASCNKDKKHIIGKWKLLEVSIYKNYKPFETIDYAGENIIYDFRSTNKLIVSGNVPDDLFVFDNFQPGQHHYKYKDMIDCPTCFPGTNLSIKQGLGKSEELYYCLIDLDNGTMQIGEDKVIGGKISENGGRTGGDFYTWGKSFIKIK
ncbi:MAG: hypothetical protein LBL13_11250 [Bacteroidales bacterium]|jgi:hypothetical protein|nr:hypothetical protein [Bacteroidales bacterium]